MQKEKPTKYTITIAIKRKIIKQEESYELQTQPKNLNSKRHASDIQIINSTSKTINDIINKKVNKNKNSSPEEGAYSIRYTTYNKPYIGGTFRPLKKRIYEHKQALLKKKSGISYALVLHRNKEKHNFDLKGAKIIKHMSNKKK